MKIEGAPKRAVDFLCREYPRILDRYNLINLALKVSDNLILAAFGGGFTWASIYVKWAYNPKN